MQKKLIAVLSALVLAFTCAACSDDKQPTEEIQEPWKGVYYMINEETAEFKVLTVTSQDENGVSMQFESVRSSDEFTAPFKSTSGKYAVLNAGDRCLKFSLKSPNSSIRVDDMWTNEETKRNENWSGKYEVLEDMPELSFGDKKWNGEYVQEQSGLEISVYSVRENIVLVTYKDPAVDEGVVNIRCNLSYNNEKEAVFTDFMRTVKIALVKSNYEIEISDDGTEGINISGKYFAKGE